MRDVIFALLPNVVLLDVAGPADAFRNANWEVPNSYRLRFVAPDVSVQAAVGLQLSALEALPARLEQDAIIVIAGVSGKLNLGAPATRKVIQWLASGVADSALLMCVCAGSVIAAKAGLLAGRECTTHHAYIEALRAVEPRARVLDSRIFVEDGSIFSSAGVTAGLDLALYIIGRQLGPRVAAEVARHLVVYMRTARHWTMCN